MTIKDKKELYTILWKEARRLYSKYDLCKSKSGKSCLAYKRKIFSKPFCCCGCKYLGKYGCKVQNLCCALHCCFLGEIYFPFPVNKRTHKIQMRLYSLRKIADKYEIPLRGRKSKYDCFKIKITKPYNYEG